MGKNKYDKEEMKKKYIKLCYELGRVANRDDINSCEDLPHYDTFLSRFGSMSNLHKATGINKNNELTGKPLKSEVEKILIEKRIFRGRRLDYMEIQNDKDLPSIGYVRRVYNYRTLREIWDEVEKKIPKNIADYLGI